jgi:hypothetical protein
MGSLANYTENKLLEHLFKSDFTAPSTLYIALHTGDPGETGASNEVSGSNYARVSKARGTTHFTVSGNSVVNATRIEFPQPSASWGVVTHFSIWDASSSGNCIAYGSLTSSLDVTGSTIIVYFDPGDLTGTLD